MGFSSKVAERALVCCGRHCCICHKFCGIKIELHHIVPQSDDGEDTFDNCIPLCFDCHADVMAYNPDHPKGRKYTVSELKTHRNAWYNQVRHLRVHGVNDMTANQTISEPLSSEDVSDFQLCLERIDFVSDQVLEKASGITQNSEVETPESTVIGNESHSSSYVYSTPAELEYELMALDEQLRIIAQEKEFAESLGLEGTTKAAEDEMKSIQEQIQTFKKRIEVVKQGYEFWDKLGFEIACESYYFQCRWHCLGYVRDDGVFASGDYLQIRIPLYAQRALKTAIDSRLFERFQICEALDHPTEIFDLELNDYTGIIEKGGYYLFGSPVWSDYDIFYISQWDVNFF